MLLLFHKIYHIGITLHKNNKYDHIDIHILLCYLDSKAAIRRKDLQEKKATKNRRNARCKKQRLTVVADTDSYKNGASAENGLLSGGHCDDVKDDVPHKRDIKEAANKITSM